MKESFILYTEYKEQVELLEPEEQGELFMAILTYASGEPVDWELSRPVQMAFAFIRARMDKDAEKYLETVEKRRKAGEISAAKREAQANTTEQKPTQANKSQQKATQSNTAEQVPTNSTDNDNEYVYVYKEKDTLTSIPKERRFTPPALADVQEYADQYTTEKGIPPIDAGAFCDFYASKGWMVGKNRMKDWRAAVRNWARGDGARAAPARQKSPVRMSATHQGVNLDELITAEGGNW